MASVVTGKGEERNSSIVNRKKSGTKQRVGSTSVGQDNLSLQGRIRAERDKAIQGRQSEIEKVIEMHDSLVFHIIFIPCKRVEQFCADSGSLPSPAFRFSCNIRSCGMHSFDLHSISSSHILYFRSRRQTILQCFNR
jgi:hypothetical protein